MTHILLPLKTMSSQQILEEYTQPDSLIDSGGLFFAANEYRACFEIAVKGLHRLACWEAGPTVDSSFDNPCPASEARETLASLGIYGPQEDL